MFAIALDSTFTVSLSDAACLRIARACREMGKGSPCGEDGPAYEALTALFAAASMAIALHGMTLKLSAIDEEVLARISAVYGAY